jgi:hypothetical protein
MMSLNQRILLSATLVLLIFIVGIAIALDRAFYDSARLGVQDRMLARILLLMGDAEVDEQGTLFMPSNLLDSEFSRPDAATYALIIDQAEKITWQSTSALNKQIPALNSDNSTASTGEGKSAFYSILEAREELSKMEIEDPSDLCERLIAVQNQLHTLACETFDAGDMELAN